ncbi:MAG: S-layer homology domain-containing protein [Clostridiales bacterium]|nr:S-layer homology domain-containing protein [Clostridiales bacterium]
MSKKWLVFMLFVVMVLVMMPTDIIAHVSTPGTISAGNVHSMAIKSDGSLWTWGGNFAGQLGDGKNRYAPDKVLDDISLVCAGYYHSLAIKTNGSLLAWGGNSEGQLGDGTTTEKILPVKIMDSVINVSARYYHSLAIKSDGSLWAWGNNSDGRLGDGSTTNSPLPVKIMDATLAVSAGTAHSLAIKTDGSLWAWGVNKSGQLGDGTTAGRLKPFKIMDDVAAISAGDYYSLAIKTDGSLWAWGANQSGQLGDGTTTQRLKPVKIIDNAIVVSAGEDHTVAIKSDGSLWAWGSNNYGKLGDGTTTDRYAPVKIADDVVAASAGYYHSLAIKKDGSLWAWGSNAWGQIGDRAPDTNNRYKPGKIMDDIQFTTYIYDKPDPGDSLVLPVDRLTAVTDKAGAVSAINEMTSGLSDEAKTSSTGIDLVTLYAEEAVAQAASLAATGDVVINRENIIALQTRSAEVKTAARQILASSGITLQREFNTGLRFKVADGSSLKIIIDPSAASLTSGSVSVQTPGYALTFSAESIETNVKDNRTLIITVKEINSPTLLAFNNDPKLTLAFLAEAGNSKTYNITFSKEIEKNIRVSLPPVSGDPIYQAVTNASGVALGGKYNPVTQTIDVKIKDSGSYTVKENRKTFKDIENKSQEMRDAIEILTSKGIIKGTGATTFSPDNHISRAEIASILTRALSKYDPNADGGFNDVQKNDWYFGVAGSAKKHKFMEGTGPRTFSPNLNIPKDQIVAVAARALRIEMKYRNPADEAKVLSVYKDAGTLANWSKTDIALATKENLVVLQTDDKFSPRTTMTRGDAAIILYRLFNKIW